jgi:hypothetical protein
MGGVLLNTIKGKIIAIQEERFRLMSSEGRGYIMTLAKHTSTGVRDLAYWRETGALVEVAYSGQPHLDTGVAWDVRPA